MEAAPISTENGTIASATTTTTPTNATAAVKQSRFLIIDTSAFIKETRFEKFHTSELYTVEEVMKEVRDKKARQYLTSMPYRIKTREPTPESYVAAMEFAKKTGDYASLSATDLKVIALTLTLEKEVYGAANIRTEPNTKVGGEWSRER
jgi:RNA-binding protein NOB1